MIVYELTADDPGIESSTYFAVLGEARQARDEWYGGRGQIERLELVALPPRRLAVRLLNGAGFVRRREPVT